MSDFDWRMPNAYDRAKDAEITGFAWECLRRNPDYRREHQEIPPAQPFAVDSAFRQRWGLCFRS